MDSPADYSSALTILAGMIGSGGLVTLVTIWMNNRAQASKDRQAGGELAFTNMGQVNNAYKEYVEIVKGDLARFQKTVDRLEEANRVLKEEYDVLQAEYRALHADNIKLRAEIEQLKKINEKKMQ